MQKTHQQGVIMDVVNLIINLVAGAVGGNVGGAAVSKENSLGTLGNTIAGLVGGPTGAWIATALGLLAQTGALGVEGTAQEINWGHLIGQIASSGVGGAVLSALAGFIKGKL